MRTTRRCRSAVSAASRSLAWAISSALRERGWAPSARAMVAYRALVPEAGVGVEMSWGRGGVGDGAVHVAAGDERGRGPGGPAVEEHLDRGQVLGVVAQLDAPPGQRRVDGVGVSFERDGGGAGDLAGHRPAERLAQ